MAQVDSGVQQIKYSLGINKIDDDHQAIFSYIEKLHQLEGHPENYDYAVDILDSFITFFLEHTIKEEQLLQKYLPQSQVNEHILLHKNELKYLDKYLTILKQSPSLENIELIVKQLNREFKNHIYRYDKKIMEQLLQQQNNDFAN